MSDILSEISVWGDNDSSGRPMLMTDELFRKANKKEKFVKKTLNYLDQLRILLGIS